MSQARRDDPAAIYVAYQILSWSRNNFEFRYLTDTWLVSREKRLYIEKTLLLRDSKFWIQIQK